MIVHTDYNDADIRELERLIEAKLCIISSVELEEVDMKENFDDLPHFRTSHDALRYLLRRYVRQVQRFEQWEAQKEVNRLKTMFPEEDRMGRKRRQRK